MRGLTAGAKVTLGIRPRNLEIVHEPVDDGLSSVVDIIEPMGAETLAHLNDGSHDMRVVTGWRTPIARGRAGACPLAARAGACVRRAGRGGAVMSDGQGGGHVRGAGADRRGA